MIRTVTKKDMDVLEQYARDIRVDIIAMIAQAKSGHPGGSLSMVEILVSLFFHVMNVDPAHPHDEKRDRFHLSKGHACPALYAVLARRGYFAHELLGTLRTFGSILQGHPHPKAPGIEVASGSLGQGLSVACGMALAGRLNKTESRVFTILGDGETQEGQPWEAAMFASHYKLDNLYVFVDANGIQIDGKVKDVMNVEPLPKKWEAFGCEVREIDGHSITAIIDTLRELEGITGKPKVIIARTVKGKGISFMEHNADFHGKAPSSDETKKAMTELRGV